MADGFLQDLGLTDLTAEEAERNRRRQQFGLGVQAQTDSIDRTPGLSPAERDARKIGAIFGNLLGSRKFMGGGNLNDREQAGITAVQSAQNKLRELQKIRPELTGELASEKFKQILSGELAMVGQVDQALQVGKQAQEEFRARRKQELELKRLGIQTDRESIGKELDEGRATRDIRGQVSPVWPKGATREDEAVMAFMQNDGKMVTADGEVLELGDFSIFPPPKPVGGGRPLTANDLGISDREQKEIRDQVGAVGAMARGAVAMREALAESAQLGAGVNIMDGTGKITGAANKVLEIASGVARSIGATLDVQDADGQSQGILSQAPTAAKYVSRNFKELDESLFDLVPSHLRKSEVARAKYYSALTRITYAQARSNEPGARQLSDEDFRRSLVQMAGNASDPEAFRQVMQGNMNEAVDALTMRQKIIGRDRMELIVAPGGLRAMDEELAKFRTSFGQDFGSAAEPSPALTTDPESGVRRVGGATFTPDPQ
jgi:hypothetical protein